MFQRVASCLGGSIIALGRLSCSRRASVLEGVMGFGSLRILAGFRMHFSSSRGTIEKLRSSRVQTRFLDYGCGGMKR